jgi:hypothetical protein
MGLRLNVEVTGAESHRGGGPVDRRVMRVHSFRASSHKRSFPTF